MGIPFTLRMGFLFTVTMGILLTIALAIQLTISTPRPASGSSTGWRGSTLCLRATQRQAGGGPCLNHRVLVPVQANGAVLPA